MNRITVLWSMNAAACLTLAAIYLLVWCKERENWVHLLFSCSAVAAAVIALIELAMLHGNTVGQYAELVRWIHVPVWMLTLFFVAFVRLYLRAGRTWLAWSIYGLRTAVLILNFVLTPNINFRAITSIRHFSWWGGEIVSVPVGMPNPWGVLSNLSLLLLVVFCIDATITVWRRGDRRRALVVGGSMIFGTIVACHVPLVIWGIINVPFFLGFAYSGIVLAMGYELSNDMLRTAQLAKQLEASEADLRETQKRMELAANAAELGMWMWDIPRDEVWLTDKGRALFGFDSSEKLDLNRFRSRLHPEDREAVLNAVGHSLRTGAEYESEYRAVLPEGQIRWIAGRGHVEFNGEGQPIRMRGVSVDITKRKEAELERMRHCNEMARLARRLEADEAMLRDSKERIELATKAAGLIVWTWDIGRNEVWLSEKDRDLLGFSRSEQLTAERIRSVVYSEDRQFLRKLVERSLTTPEEVEGKYRIVLADGSVRWVTRRGRVEFNRDGKPALERGVLMDITERKEAEEQAERHRNEMAHLSRVTTLGELSGSIAHELNQPLSAILGNAQAAQRILANGADLTEIRDILNEIVSENQRASEVIRRLRQWLKKGEVQQHSVDISEVVQDVLKLIRSDLINQKVTVDTELARNLPTIAGDPVQLQQVLLNLIVNACDAMIDCKTPERRLVIRTVAGNGSDGVIVSVTDRGSGVPEEKIAQIFEPFFTTKGKGMGLGLSVCRAIIAAHRGKLWATNNTHRGATFHFSLPMSVPDKEVPITSHLTNMQSCSHGAVRRLGPVAPNGVDAPQGRGYNVTRDS